MHETICLILENNRHITSLECMSKTLRLDTHAVDEILCYDLFFLFARITHIISIHDKCQDEIMVKRLGVNYCIIR